MRLRGGCLSRPAAEVAPGLLRARGPGHVVTALGITQILAWGSSYYLLAVLARPIARDTGWSLGWIVGGVSLGLLMAGLISPRVGDAIGRYGGRPVLAGSALLLALGLGCLAVAPNLAVYLFAWLIIGLGMGAGLYDAAFSTLGRLYGQKARMAIATLTLFGGFASTACWPLSAALVSAVGWRGTCLAYAGIHIAILLPLYLFVLPVEEKREAGLSPKNAAAGEPQPSALPQSGIFVLLCAAVTLASMISTLISVHLLSLLQARGIALAAAVALGTIVGPSQVGARAIEMIVARYHHPIWTLIVGTIGVAIGMGILWSGLPILAVALVFYGAGIGIDSIARGTVPLAIFGEASYAAIMGRLAMPSLLGQAAAPAIGAFLLERFGADRTAAALFAAAVVDAGLALSLLIVLGRLRQRRGDAT